MTLEERIEALRKEIDELRKQLVDFSLSTSCQVGSLRIEIQTSKIHAEVLTDQRINRS